MRLLALATLAITAFVTTMIIDRSGQCPLCPQKQTFASALSMSGANKRTSVHSRKIDHEPLRRFGGSLARYWPHATVTELSTLYFIVRNAD